MSDRLLRAGAYCANQGVPGDREILITRRAFWNPLEERPMSFGGEWVIPGGRKHRKESYLAAAIRELREEVRYSGRVRGSRWLCSVDTSVLPDEDVSDGRYLHSHARYFVGQIDARVFQLPHAGEVIAYSWMTPENALALVNSPEFHEAQLEEFRQRNLGDPRYGSYALTDRRPPIGTVSALEVLIEEDCAALSGGVCV